MFGIDITVLAIVGLAALAAGAVGYGVLFSRIEADKKVESRLKRVKSAETDHLKVKAARDRVSEVSKRRKSVADSLKKLEDRQKETKKEATALPDRLVQAGLKISVSQFYMLSAVLGFVLAILTFLSGSPLLVAAGAGIVGALGLPRWILSFLRKRRLKAFLAEFPNALEVMVRSIKSGLPLNDAVRLISSDGQEPVKTEFLRIIESQQLGLSIPDACMRMTRSIPTPEANFFAIVIQIQSQAGGNLSEALGNLAKVLRERKKMKAKVQALSMEAKASACIIGALPFIVSLLVYMTSPDYMMILFTHPTGHFIMGCSAIWMFIGIMVMRNMINFEI